MTGKKAVLTLDVMSLDLALHHDFTAQEKAFAELVSTGIDLALAAEQAGYSKENAAKESSRILQRPHILAAVQISVARRLAVGAPIALRVLQEFALDKDTHPKIRLDAAKTLLDRAGHVPPKAMAPGKAGETPLNEMTTGELRELAEKLENEIAGRAKEVSSTKAAPRAAQAIDGII